MEDTSMRDKKFITIGEIIEEKKFVEPRLSVVIPANNEAKTVGDVVKGALKFADEVIVVDDGSKDSTAYVAKAAGAKVIRFPRNSGYGNALSTGISTAAMNGADIIAWLDADGQHDPDEIPRVCEPILRGEADLVIGSRFINGNGESPRYRTIGQKVLTKATNLANGTEVTDSQSGFRCITKKAALSLNLTENAMGISSEMIIDAQKLNLRMAEVPISCKYEGLDTSSMKPVRHGANVLSSILRIVRDEHPLLLFGLGGLLLAIIGVSVGLYSIYQYISYKALPFFPTIIGVLFFFVGLISIFAGIILNALAINRERRHYAN